MPHDAALWQRRLPMIADRVHGLAYLIFGEEALRSLRSCKDRLNHVGSTGETMSVQVVHYIRGT